MGNAMLQPDIHRDRSIFAGVSPQEGLGKHMVKHIAALAAAVALIGIASPALAASGPSTKLIRCGSESCLLVSGHRDDPSSIVSINDHEVTAEGKRSWRVLLPLETVREWSSPHARTIEVSLRDGQAEAEEVASADLPIGLLGHAVDLASLVVVAH